MRSTCASLAVAFSCLFVTTTAYTAYTAFTAYTTCHFQRKIPHNPRLHNCRNRAHHTQKYPLQRLEAVDASIVTDLLQNAPESMQIQMEEESLSLIGHDLLLFLAASVVVEPLGKILSVTPVLLYLLLGFVAGPYGLSLFASGTQVTSEIGDFGILFLLFVEGLNLSPERLAALGEFLSLGAIQLAIPWIDQSVLQAFEQKPVVAFCIAAAGALSSSAFVLPILKEKGWEREPDGIAALSVLLLQDLAVAPLLVLLPLLADTGGNSMDAQALGILLLKATVGFGLVLVVASFGLRQIFAVVAKFGSAQTFVAASLLVAAGMGTISDELGLSATTGAFAAGVLLAESGYRAQIEADIKPFEGILLGIFFVTAGAALDPRTLLQEGPTLAAGIFVFVATKFVILFAAGQRALGLSTDAQAIRVALLLAGGGEFAFVVFKLASDVGILSEDLYKILTASVILSMSLTPLLGEVAAVSSQWLEERDREKSKPSMSIAAEQVEFDLNISDDLAIREAFERFDEDGSGTICAEELAEVLTQPGSVEPLAVDDVQKVMRLYDKDGDGTLTLDEFSCLWTSKRCRPKASSTGAATEEETLANAIVVCGYGETARQLCQSLTVPYVVFSQNPELVSLGVAEGARIVYGNGAAPALVQSVGVSYPKAIVVTYGSAGRCLDATQRLRTAFPDTPLYVRASQLRCIDELEAAGATKVLVESRTVAKSFLRLMELLGTASDIDKQPLKSDEDDDVLTGDVVAELSYEYDMDPEEIRKLHKLFVTSLNRNDQGQVQLAELRDELMRQSDKPLDDATLKKWMGYEEFLSKWVTGEAEVKWITFPQFIGFASGKL